MQRQQMSTFKYCHLSLILKHKIQNSEAICHEKCQGQETKFRRLLHCVVKRSSTNIKKDAGKKLRPSRELLQFRHSYNTVLPDHTEFRGKKPRFRPENYSVSSPLGA